MCYVPENGNKDSYIVENSKNDDPKNDENNSPRSSIENEKFKPKLWPQIIATLAATSTSFGMGTVEAWTSTGLPSLVEKRPFGDLSHNTQGQIASFALLAALASGPPIGFLVNKVGRRGILILLGLLYVTGYALMAGATNLGMFFVGRCITGFCAGASSLVAPIYIGEISEKSRRGLLGSGFQLMATVGILFSYVVGTVVDWQWTAIACAIYPMLGVLLLLWVPSSPRFLLSKKKRAEAMAALMWLRGADNEEQVKGEFMSIEGNLTMYAHKKKSIRDVFKLRTLKPLTICFMLLLFQQLSGIEAVLMYTVHIFEEAGANLNPNYCTIIVGVLQVLATFIEVGVVDKAGRRRMLLISEFGAGGATLALAGFFYFKETDPLSVQPYGWVPLLSLGAFILFFAIGIGPVPFLLIAELNSPRMVGLASAVGTTVNWGFGYVATFGMVWIEESLGIHWCFMMFGGVSWIGMVFVYFCCPETKGRTMEEIQKYFQKKKKNEGEEKI